ncbi:hypothetical protein PIIN_08366 [Serendipita indica DSM 11827]|uniref:Uncharacterized protein n=1 Tax=Serendipita indica (strain DSM 11827) TaxID=1109443 RepID=G4TSX1_SERID|nr:hypothetical protein PIIN_08366 [Serendipita indica DSM 11827]
MQSENNIGSSIPLRDSIEAVWWAMYGRRLHTVVSFKLISQRYRLGLLAQRDADTDSAHAFQSIASEPTATYGCLLDRKRSLDAESDADSGQAIEYAHASTLLLLRKEAHSTLWLPFPVANSFDGTFSQTALHMYGVNDGKHPH